MQIELTAENIKKTFEVAEKFLGNDSIETYMNYAFIELNDKKALVVTSDGNHSFSSPFEIDELKRDKEEDNKLKFLLPMRPFMTLLKDLPQNKFTVIVEGQKSIKIKGKNFKYSLPVRSSDFGFLKPDTLQNSLKINSKDLCDAFEKVIYAASKELEKRHLMAVYIKMDKDQTDIVSTDSHRLAYKVVDTKSFIQTDKPTDVLIPSMIVQNIIPLLKIYEGECELKIYDNVIQLVFNNGVIVTGRKIDEPYPDYKKFSDLNMNEHEIVTKRKQLINSLRRLNKMSDISIVEFNYNNNQLLLKVREADKGEGEETLEIINKDNIQKTAYYNAQFIIDALNIISTEEVILRVGEDILKPMGIKEFKGDNNYINIVMPIQIK